MNLLICVNCTIGVNCILWLFEVHFLPSKIVHSPYAYLLHSKLLMGEEWVGPLSPKGEKKERVKKKRKGKRRKKSETTGTRKKKKVQYPVPVFIPLASRALTKDILGRRLISQFLRIK